MFIIVILNIFCLICEKLISKWLWVTLYYENIINRHPFTVEKFYLDNLMGVMKAVGRSDPERSKPAGGLHQVG